MLDLKKLMFELLVACAWADGVLEPAEEASLRAAAREFVPDASPEELNQYLQKRLRFQDVFVEFPPEARSQVFGYSLLRKCHTVLSAKDGIQPDEAAFLVTLGSAYGFESDFVELMLSPKAQAEVAHGIS